MRDMTRERERLLEKLQKTLVPLLDEIFMISQQLLGSLEENVGKMVHEFTNVSQERGGIPVVVIFGDDYQPPSVTCNGATAVLSQVGEYTSLSNNKKEWNRMMQFLALSESVIELDKVVRQASDQKNYTSILGCLRFGWTKSSDRVRLKTLVLDEDNYSGSEIKDVSSESLHLFARHADMVAYNDKRLAEIASDNDPLADITVQDESTGSANNFSARHLEKLLTSRKHSCVGEPWSSNVKQIINLHGCSTIGQLVELSILYTKTTIIQIVGICPR
jgi:hypothetical protein